MCTCVYKCSFEYHSAYTYNDSKRQPKPPASMQYTCWLPCIWDALRSFPCQRKQVHIISEYFYHVKPYMFFFVRRQHTALQQGRHSRHTTLKTKALEPVRGEQPWNARNDHMNHLFLRLGQKEPTWPWSRTPLLHAKDAYVGSSTVMVQSTMFQLKVRNAILRVMNDRLGIWSCATVRQPIQP